MAVRKAFRKGARNSAQLECTTVRPLRFAKMKSTRHIKRDGHGGTEPNGRRRRLLPPSSCGAAGRRAQSPVASEAAALTFYSLPRNFSVKPLFVCDARVLGPADASLRL